MSLPCLLHLYEDGWVKNSQTLGSMLLGFYLISKWCELDNLGCDFTNPRNQRSPSVYFSTCQGANCAYLISHLPAQLSPAFIPRNSPSSSSSCISIHFFLTVSADAAHSMSSLEPEVSSMFSICQSLLSPHPVKTTDLRVQDLLLRPVESFSVYHKV